MPSWRDPRTFPGLLCLCTVLLVGGCRHSAQPGASLAHETPVLGTAHAAPAKPAAPVAAASTAIHPPHDHGPRPPGTGEPPLAIFSSSQGALPPGSRVTCPVCGDEFTIESKLPTRQHKGKTLVFCCQRCLPHFDKNPDLFTDQE